MTLTDRTKHTQPHVAPFGPTATVIAVSAIAVLTQFYGSIPLFSPVAAEFAVDAGSIAWVQTAFGIAYAAAFVAWGLVVDRFGPRRVMLFGLTLLVVATFLVSFAPTYGWFIFGRVVQGILAASFAPGAFSYLGTRPAPERRVLSITVLTSSFLATAVIGQVAAQAITARLDWPWFFWISAVVLAVVVAAIRLVFLPDLSPVAIEGHPVAILARLLTRVPVLLLLVATVMILGPMIALYTAISSSGLATGNALLALRASALPALIWAPFGNRWLSRFTPLQRLIAAFVVAAVASAAVALVSESVTGTGVALFFVAAAASVSAPAMIQAIVSYSPLQRGSLTALYICFLFLGASLAPFLVAAAHASLAAAAVASGVACFVGAVLVVLNRVSEKGA